MKRVKSSARPVKNTAASVPGLSPIILPAPRPVRQTTMFAALKRRRTVRAIGDRRLSIQVLANILWAAGGLNRRKGCQPGSTTATAPPSPKP